MGSFTFFIGVIWTAYLVAFVVMLWRKTDRSVSDMFAFLCMAANIVFIGLSMWKGLANACA